MMMTLLLTAALLGQADERLDLMRHAAESYKFVGDEAKSVPLKLQPDPAFRLGKQGTGTLKDGAIFLWLDAVGRPEVGAQFFLMGTNEKPQGIWVHEFSTLSTAPLTATRDGATAWTPKEAGAKFLPIPDAPKPAANASARLRQMRALAAEFRAEDDFGNRGWQALRLLPTPINRYGAAGSPIEDGALFAFVTGTDPEVFLFIEARPGPDGPAWQYGLAPMSRFALKVERKGKLVWSLPYCANDHPTQTFLALPGEP